MAETMRIVLKGEPPTAWGANNKQLFIRGGHACMTAGKNTKATEKWLISLLAPYAPTEPILGPITMQVVITWPWLSNHSKKVKERGSIPKTTRPDGDNCLKSLNDCMEDLGFFCNDSQIYCQTIQRLFGDDPGIVIVLEAEGLRSPREVA